MFHRFFVFFIAFGTAHEKALKKVVYSILQAAPMKLRHETFHKTNLRTFPAQPNLEIASWKVDDPACCSKKLSEFPIWNAIFTISGLGTATNLEG